MHSATFPPQAERRSSALPIIARQCLVWVCLLGVYFNFALPVGPSRLYGFVGVFAGLFLLAVNLGGKKWLYRMIAGLLAILAVVILGGPDVEAHWLNNSLGALQLTLSLLASLGLASELMRWKPQALRKLALWATVALLALGALEVLGPLRDTSDSFRRAVYGASELFVYDSDERDERLHGGIRPKIFTQEPSHPAKFLAVMLAVWFILARNRMSKWVGLAIMSALAYVTTRSPSLVIAAVVIGYAIFAPPGAPRSWRRTAFVTLLIIGLVTFEWWVALIPSQRAEAVAAGEDASSLMRFIAPLAITREVLLDSPLFGLGLGSRGSAMPTVLAVYGRYLAVNVEAVADGKTALWSNATFQLVCYMGIVGTAAFLWWVRRFAKFVLPDFATVLVCFIAVFSVEGTFAIMRPWAYLFILLAAFHLRQRGQASIRS